ncbi:MAG: flagellar hook-length control protein FliK [Paenibacillus dendritiformis]|uniref:flagellar hook-length control protein FliK n=1 Tax=uncultured Paenibacillus sp. TaxID=227322 RepID=UPI0025D6730A|nr:flagellar hook-length control protein FliK [uncultured Paenibacillus sp.]MDU5142129.1 flagellar hook-length control protein FliK [Paenibacillus dendritiformis]
MAGSIMNISAGSAAPVMGGAQAKAGAADGGAGFWTVLSQCMDTSGEAPAWAGGLASLLTLGEDIGNMPALPEEAAEAVEALLQPLLDSLESADDELESNPELFAALQQWVLQAQQWLNGQQPNAEHSDAASQSPNVLIEQPSTITIAVRDVLAQLAGLLEAKQADAPVLAQLAGSGQAAAAAETALAMQSQAQAGAGRQTQGAGSELPHPAASATGEQAQPAEGLRWIARLADMLKQAGEANGPATAASANAGRAGAAQAQSVTQADIMPAASAGIKPAAEAASGPDHAQPEPQIGQVMQAGQWALRQEGLNSTKPLPVIHADRFADEMAGFMVKQLRFSRIGTMSEAKISLYPEHLGQVEIRLTIQNGQLTARFLTEHLMAKDMLEQQMSMLRGALQSQGIQVEKIEVSQQSSNALNSSPFQEERRQQDTHRQQSSERGSKQGKPLTLDELAGALETEEELRAAQLLGGNSTFSASV